MVTQFVDVAAADKPGMTRSELLTRMLNFTDSYMEAVSETIDRILMSEKSMHGLAMVIRASR